MTRVGKKSAKVPSSFFMLSFLINNAYWSMDMFLNQRWDTSPILAMPEIHNSFIYSTSIKTPACCRHCSSTETAVNKTLKKVLPCILVGEIDKQNISYVSDDKHHRETYSREKEYGLPG